MKAIVLEKKGCVNLREIDICETLSPDSVRIRPQVVGICGSDVHYYNEGRIGDFVVDQPMVLGHEASGIVLEIGSDVKGLAVGDRVCMEPGVPDFASFETLSGMYNLDPTLRFWATPPVHGCLRESVVHPAALTFKLPDQVSNAQGALVEPLAIGLYAVQRSALSCGSRVLVVGAGTIGIVTALAAKAAGASKVFIADVKREKLRFVKRVYNHIIPMDLSAQNILEATASAGIKDFDVVFEASGNRHAFEHVSDLLRPRGKLLLIGMPSAPVTLDIVGLQVKEIHIDTIFRYANVFPKVIALIASGMLDVEPLITKTYSFKDGCAAFAYAATLPPSEVKIAIECS